METSAQAMEIGQQGKQQNNKSRPIWKYQNNRSGAAEISKQYTYLYIRKEKNQNFYNN